MSVTVRVFNEDPQIGSTMCSQYIGLYINYLMYLRVLRQNVMVRLITWKVVGVSRSALRNCRSVRIVRKSNPNSNLKGIGKKFGILFGFEIFLYSIQI